MTNEQRLKEAMGKAVRNGWNDSDGHKGSYLDKDISGIIIGMWHIEKIIFSTSFAKAYWGNKVICKDGTTYKTYLKSCLEAGITKEEAKMDWEVDEECITLPLWQYHQHKMLDEIQEGRNPVKYLEKFL